MLRGFRLLICGLAFLAATSGAARSQYYYPYGVGDGGFGFGGWGGGGGTVGGSYLRGLGAFAEGAGVYNYDTAQADAIETDTSIRLNNYLWQSELESRRRYNAEHAQKLNMDKAHYDARIARIRDNPTLSDIDSGNSLNMMLDQMVDPKVMSGSASGLRLANANISAAAIRDIPFRDETDAITLSLDQLTDAAAWPLPLRADTFKVEREAYQKAIDDALAEDKDTASEEKDGGYKEGTIKPETVTRVRQAVAALYQKVDSTIPKTNPDHLTAINYLKGLAGLSRMLERSNVEAVLGELEKVQNTTVGNLVAFMHTYNLRFGPATTPKQKAIYRDIHPIFVAQRDKVVGKPGDAAVDNSPPSKIDNPTAMFHGMDSTHLVPPRPSPSPDFDRLSSREAVPDSGRPRSISNARPPDPFVDIPPQNVL